MGTRVLAEVTGGHRCFGILKETDPSGKKEGCSSQKKHRPNSIGCQKEEVSHQGLKGCRIASMA